MIAPTYTCHYLKVLDKFRLSTDTAPASVSETGRCYFATLSSRRYTHSKVDEICYSAPEGTKCIQKTRSDSGVLNQLPLHSCTHTLRRKDGWMSFSGRRGPVVGRGSQSKGRWFEKSLSMASVCSLVHVRVGCAHRCTSTYLC